MPFTLDASCIVTSDQAERFFGVDPATLTDSQRFQYELSLNAASASIQRETGLFLKKATWAEVLDSQESDTVIPAEFPLRAVISVKIASDGDFASAVPVDPKLYLVHSGQSCVTFRHGYRVPRDRGSLEVTYEAGYEPLPSDLTFACLALAQFNLRTGGCLGQDSLAGVESIEKMNETLTKDKTIAQKGMPMEIYAIVKRYMRQDAPLNVMINRVS